MRGGFGDGDRRVIKGAPIARGQRSGEKSQRKHFGSLIAKHKDFMHVKQHKDSLIKVIEPWHGNP